jgi:hypothetical protein
LQPADSHTDAAGQSTPGMSSRRARAFIVLHLLNHLVFNKPSTQICKTVSPSKCPRAREVFEEKPGMKIIPLKTILI